MNRIIQTLPYGYASCAVLKSVAYNFTNNTYRKIDCYNSPFNIPDINLNVDTSNLYPLPYPSFETNIINTSLFNLIVTKKFETKVVEGKDLIPTVPYSPGNIKITQYYNYMLKLAINGNSVNSCDPIIK